MCLVISEGLKPANRDCRRDNGSLVTFAVEPFRGIGGGGGVRGIPVTNLEKVAMARKQNLAGVVNANRIGRICGLSMDICQ